ncbi:drainin [Planoprotostelium fungivorum]|uniref:Drainin n=1 Tax=Planoprotostelium fungivorum TaxID=1890364 RepID=A0A2P6NHC6_9EUKA|nr:drainin [Planoprotostelium fungivorum]
MSSTLRPPSTNSSLNSSSSSTPGNGSSGYHGDDGDREVLSSEDLSVMEDIYWEINPFDLVEWRKLFESLDSREAEFMLWACQQEPVIRGEQLGCIWTLSDIDKDTSLSFDEFSIALFLINHVHNKGKKIPKSLPNEWLPTHQHRVYSRSAQFPGLVKKSRGVILKPETSPSSVNNSQRRQDDAIVAKGSGGSVFYINGVPMQAGDCVVSAPRPSHLPPKTTEENMKHMREAELIQAKLKKHLEQEEKERERREELKAIKDKKMQENKKYWLSVIDTWPQKKSLPKTKLLWWQGFPPSVRGKMWELSLSNDLNITRDLFVIFGAHARSTKDARAAKKRQDRVKEGETGEEIREEKRVTVEGEEKEITNVVVLGREDTVDLIHLDLPRTFPALSIFQPDGPCHNQLKDVLEAYVCYRPDIGYVQGMSYIAAVLLLNLDTFPAFKVLANLLNKQLFRVFFKMAQDEVEAYMNWFDSLVCQYLPKVHKKLVQMDIKHTYTVDWIMTMFSKALPIDIAMRIWDMSFLEGESFIVRCSLGLLKYYSNKIEKAPFEGIMHMLTKLPEIEEEELFAAIEKIDFTMVHMSKFVVAIRFWCSIALRRYGDMICLSL